MSAKVQVTLDFLHGVNNLIHELKTHENTPEIKILCKHLEKEIKAKFDALERRTAYARTVTSPKGSKEREAHRQDYLEKSGIPQDWRNPEDAF